MLNVSYVRNLNLRYPPHVVNPKELYLFKRLVVDIGSEIEYASTIALSEDDIAEIKSMYSNIEKTYYSFKIEAEYNINQLRNKSTSKKYHEWMDNMVFHPIDLRTIDVNNVHILTSNLEPVRYFIDACRVINDNIENGRH